MVLDGLRGYIQLANGLTDVTRERARSAARVSNAVRHCAVLAIPGCPPRSRPLRAGEARNATAALLPGSAG